MANSYSNGRIYLDTASEQVVSTDRRIKINYILFIPDNNGDQIVIKEHSTGNIAFKLSSATAKEERFLDFSRSPILLNGVYIDTVSSGAIAILYTTSKGVS